MIAVLAQLDFRPGRDFRVWRGHLAYTHRWWSDKLTRIVTQDRDALVSNAKAQRQALDHISAAHLQRRVLAPR
jgi:hypothetical protein